MDLLLRLAPRPLGRDAVVLLVRLPGYFGVFPLQSGQRSIFASAVQSRKVSAADTSHEAERRSTRIRAQIPVRVTSLDPAFKFSERCHTLIVNTQGCGLRVSTELPAGTQVLLDELPSGLKATGIVANAVPLGSEGKYWLVGVALDRVGNIWGLHPAPADWGETMPTAQADAAPASVPVARAVNSSEWPYSQFSRRGEFHPGRR